MVGVRWLGMVGSSVCSASVRGRSLSSLRRERPIAFGAAIAEELPNFADFRNHVQVEIGHDYFIFVPTGLRDNFAARIAEVALAVELSDAPRLFDADAIHGADKIAVGDGVRRLLELPQIF